MIRYDTVGKTARVTVTIPVTVLKAADKLAKRERRSRSWVVSEALRSYVDASRRAAASAGRVAEPVVSPHTADFDAARLDRVQSDLALTPEERVRLAEELARTATIARPQPRVHQVLAFDSWEDYLSWKRTDVLR